MNLKKDELITNDNETLEATAAALNGISKLDSKSEDNEPDIVPDIVQDDGYEDKLKIDDYEDKLEVDEQINKINELARSDTHS